MKDRIKEIRLKLKLSQAEFGKKLDLTGGQIGNLEHGTTLTSYVKTKICKEFNINPIWFETGEGEMFNKDIHTNYSPYQIAVLNEMDDIPTDLQEVIMNLTKEYTRLYRATIHRKPALLGGRGWQSKSQISA